MSHYYPWSSCSSKVTSKQLTWLDDNPLYVELGATDEERRQRYREFLQQSISTEKKEVILCAVRRGQLPVGNAFVDEIESRLKPGKAAKDAAYWIHGKVEVWGKR